MLLLLVPSHEEQSVCHISRHCVTHVFAEYPLVNIQMSPYVPCFHAQRAPGKFLISRHQNPVKSVVYISTFKKNTKVNVDPNIYIYIYEGFHKWGYPKMDRLYGKSHSNG